MEEKPDESAIVLRPTDRIVWLFFGYLLFGAGTLWVAWRFLDPNWRDEPPYIPYHTLLELMPPLVRGSIFFAFGGLCFWASLLQLVWLGAELIATITPAGIRLRGLFGLRELPWSDLKAVAVQRYRRGGNWIAFQGVPLQGRSKRRKTLRVPLSPRSDRTEGEILAFVARFRPDLIPAAAAHSRADLSGLISRPEQPK